MGKSTSNEGSATTDGNALPNRDPPDVTRFKAAAAMALRPWGPDLPRVYDVFNGVHIATTLVAAPKHSGPGAPARRDVVNLRNMRRKIVAKSAMYWSPSPSRSSPGKKRVGYRRELDPRPKAAPSSLAP